MADNGFDLRSEIDRYLRRLCSGIHGKRRRGEVYREYYGHMEDEIYRLTLSGMSEAKAFRTACLMLGDLSELRQVLGGIHNRLPPDFPKTVLSFLLRLLAALAFYALTHGYTVGAGWAYPWFMYLPPFLMLFGLMPYRYLRALVSRTRFLLRLSGLCRSTGARMRVLSSPVLSVFIPSELPEIIVGTGHRTYCIRFLTCLRRLSPLHFIDETTYAIRSLLGLDIFYDRGYRYTNTNKPFVPMYSSERLHAFSFAYGPGIEVDERTEKILIVNPVPSEITFVHGSVTEFADNGSRVYDMRVFGANAFLNTLRKEAH